MAHQLLDSVGPSVATVVPGDSSKPNVARSNRVAGVCHMHWQKCIQDSNSKRIRRWIRTPGNQFLGDLHCLLYLIQKIDVGRVCPGMAKQNLGCLLSEYGSGSGRHRAPEIIGNIIGCCLRFVPGRFPQLNGVLRLAAFLARNSWTASTGLKMYSSKSKDSMLPEGNPRGRVWARRC